MRYLIRIEGLNLRHFVYDTQDLAVIRGGSLALLDLSRAGLGGLECISSGASQAVFATSEPPDPGRLRAALLAAAPPNSPLCDATLSIEWIEFPDEQKFAGARARLMSLARWKQMQTPSFVYPAIEDVASNGQRVCGRDGVRPAAKRLPHGETLSRNTFRRHEWGRDRKKRFFQEEFTLWLQDSSLADLEYSADLHEIAGKSRHKQPLRDKIAVIYLDGNKFGARFLATCPDTTSQQETSARLRRDQTAFLRDLLKRNREQQDWLFKREDGSQVFRIEVLLWGGDEITLVVPSWQGLGTLDFFFRATRLWRPFTDGQPVTHKAGIVFCNEKSNIHKAAALASELANFAKVEGRNTIAYQVLESFDHLGQSAERHFGTRYKFSSAKDSFVLNADGIGDFSKHARALKTKIPRKRLYQYARKLVSDLGTSSVPDTHGCEDDWKRYEANLFPGKPMASMEAAWLHLMELWDYFPQASGDRE